MSSQILVIEDNPDNMKLVTWALEDAGYEFLQATSAEEGLDRLERFSVDLVLMDISLPRMDGAEATRRLRQDPRFADLPVLALTAHAIQSEKERILASGVSELITKPLDEDELLASMKMWLAGKPSPS